MNITASLCACGDRARNHVLTDSDELTHCHLCDCKTFKAETDLEKLRAAFHGEHTGPDRDAVFGDYQHDATIYVTGLEHRLVQVTAVAQINIEAGRMCKAELGTANKTIAWLVEMIEEMAGQIGALEHYKNAVEGSKENVET